MRQYTLDLTWIESPSYRGFRKIIGGKAHYLGADQPSALAQACLLIAAEVSPFSCQAQGLPSPKADSMRMDISKLSEAERATWAKVLRQQLAELEGKAEPKGAGQTLYAMMEAYLDHVKAQNLAPAWQNTICQRMEAVKSLITDRDMEKLDYVSVDVWTKAVVAKYPNQYSSKNLRQAVKMFLSWAEDAGKWSCQRWQSATKVRRVVRPTKRIQQMSLEQFGKLYSAASDRMKCFMLLALNTGATQMELATLEKDHIGGGRIERARHKTGVLASWPLWTETASLLPKQLNGKAGLAFATLGGKPLVYHTSKGKADSITHAWRTVCRDSKVEGFGFKSLRKLGAQLVRDKAGLEVAQSYLSHKGLSVAEIHYTNADTSKLDAAMSAVEVLVMEAIGKPVEAQPKALAA